MNANPLAGPSNLIDLYTKLGITSTSNHKSLLLMSNPVMILFQYRTSYTLTIPLTKPLNSIYFLLGVGVVGVPGSRVCS